MSSVLMTINYIGFTLPACAVEWPMLWRITKNSLHNEGTCKWVNWAPIFFWYKLLPTTSRPQKFSKIEVVKVDYFDFPSEIFEKLVCIRCQGNWLQLLGFWNFFVCFQFFPLKLIYSWTKSKKKYIWVFFSLILCHSSQCWHQN